MRVLSVILLGIAGFCLYPAAAAALMDIRAAILGRTLSMLVLLTVMGWTVFALPRPWLGLQPARPQD